MARHDTTLSELVLARYGPEAVGISSRDGVKAAQTFLAERFDEEIEGLTETAAELRAGLIMLMPVGDGVMMMRVRTAPATAPRSPQR